MTAIRVSYFASEKDNTPRAIDLDWRQLAAQLTTTQRTPCTVETCPGSKCQFKLGAAWSPAAYPNGATRSKRHVSAVSVLVLDIDHVSDATLLEIDAKLASYRRIVHATHSDRPGDRCMRIVLDLDAPVAGADWPRFWQTVVAELGVPADPSTSDGSRIYFLPSRPSDADFLSDIEHGTAINVATILAKAPPIATPAPVVLPGAAATATEQAMHAAALELAAAWPPARTPSGGGGRHYAFLALAGALAKEGWTEDAITDLTTRVARLMPDTDEKAINDRPLQAASSVANVARGVAVTGWGDLASRLTRPDAIATAKAKLGIRDAASDVIGALMQVVAPAPPVEPNASEYGSDLRSYLGTDDPGDDPDAWLIPGVMPAGVPVVIAGHPKSQKTFVAEHMAICLAAGFDWLGRKVKRCRVLLLPREDSVRETRKRIWRLARGLGVDPRDLDGWLRIDSKTPFYFSDKADVARMHATITSWRPDLIVIDSLSRTHTGDENSKKEMSIVTSTWSDLCQLHDLTLATIHHFTKTGEGTLLQRLRGSGDLGALVRHIVGVEKHADGAIELSFDGNLHPLPEPFLMRMVDAIDRERKVIRFELVGSAIEAHFDRIDREIIEFVTTAESGGVRAAEIEKAVRGDNRIKRARLKALVASGRIVHLVKRYHPPTCPEIPKAVLIGTRLLGGES